MTGEQRQLYIAAMRIGRAFGIGGSTWTYYPPPSQDGVTSAATLTSNGTRTLYIVQEKLSVWGQPLPPQPVGLFQWRLVAPIETDIAAGGVVSNGTLAFWIGALDQYQGFPTAICVIAEVPSGGGAGMTGQPMGLRLILTYAS